jgi:hypothetical protein
MTNKGDDMSKMSQLAAEIECALDDGFSYDEIIQGLQNEYDITRAEALKMINGVSAAMDADERAREIAAEAYYA